MSGWKDEKMNEAAKGIERIKEEISESCKINMRTPYCRFKTGIRFIDKVFFYTATCEICGKGLLDRKDVLEHRKHCKAAGVSK